MAAVTPARDRAEPGLFNALTVMGHSYAAGGGPAQKLDGFVHKVARALHVKRIRDLSVGGTIACWGAPTTTASGHWGRAMQALTRDRQAAPYLCGADLVLVNLGVNDLAQLGSLALGPFTEAYRSMLARARAAAILEETHASVTKTGTWGNFGYAGFSGGLASYTSTVGDKVTLAQLAGAGGLPASAQLIVDQTYRFTLGVKLDGVAQPDYVVDATKQDQAAGASGQLNAIRLRWPAGFAATAELTLAAKTAGFLYFDCWGIEAAPADGPLIVALLPNKVPNYALWSGWTHGPDAGADPLNDASVDTLRAAMRAVHAEFPNVVEVDADALLGKAAANFAADGAHPNELGHAILAQGVTDAIAASSRRTPRLSHRSTFQEAAQFTRIGSFGGPGYQNSWADSGAAPPGGFRLGVDGRVYLRGNLAGTVGNYNAVMFTLDPGLRPANTLYFTVPVSGGGTALLQVVANGTVSVLAGTAANVAALTILNGVSWEAEK